MDRKIAEPDYAQGGADSQYGSYVELSHFSKMAGVKRMCSGQFTVCDSSRRLMVPPPEGLLASESGRGLSTVSVS